MDAKIIRTLKKLASIMPAELRDGWRFHVYNVGGPGQRQYGIISDNNVIPGINVTCREMWREERRWKERKPMNQGKLGNVLAAYVAFAQPATVLALIEENERLKEATRWIPLTEKVPGEGEYVLLLDKRSGYRMTGRFDHVRTDGALDFCIFESRSEEYHSVRFTHFQYLPISANAK